jgi:2,4-dienoyl-CoA reductase-like NADH-dependent reductase (Old Yellow Enzyme family)
MPRDTSALFEPLEVKGYTFANRIVMPPMASNRGVVSAEALDWYAEHAAGGVGLVIVEAVAVGRFGRDLSVEHLSRLAGVIHARGALAAMQLFPMTDRRPFDWDARPADLQPLQIRELVLEFEAASRICAEAGFDGVEPHGAHGFLLNRFFSPKDNERTDKYGGTPAKRMRLGLEIGRAARRGVGEDRLLLYRHTPVQEDGYGLDESLAFAEKLVGSGVDILDISPASAQAPADLAAPFRRFGVPVIGVGLLDDVERALEALTQGRADLVAIGRGLIADQLWPRKVREGRLAEIVKCIRCDEKCYGNLNKGLPIECTQW